MKKLVIGFVLLLVGFLGFSQEMGYVVLSPANLDNAIQLIGKEQSSFKSSDLVKYDSGKFVYQKSYFITFTDSKVSEVRFVCKEGWYSRKLVKSVIKTRFPLTDEKEIVFTSDDYPTISVWVDCSDDDFSLIVLEKR
jgi:hypothetical protein